MKSGKGSLPTWAVSITVFMLMVVVLRLLGRIWWCAAGDGGFWVSDVWSEHNSQHIADAYSFSHVGHGLLFVLAFRYLPGIRRLMQRLSFAWQFAVAAGIEAGWEVLENSPIIIERYREATMAVGYSGDSIANSIGDLAFCMIGFVFAAKVKWYWTVAVFVVIEIAMLIAIRDNLTLNVLMLIYPLEAIKSWQSPTDIAG